MAERSFAREVEDLRLGAGEVFRGEGILAVTKALLQSGVGYVAGYQGAPISHLMDVLADAQGILGDLGVHFENSASEAAAAATLAAAVMYPIRGAVTWKSTAGTNVACDALSNLASGGVTGGAVIVIGLVGSFIFGVYLQNISAGAYLQTLTLITGLPEVIIAIVKAVAFGLIAGLVGCYRGLTVGGGAKGVGIAVNETLVLCVVALFAVNVIFTTIGVRFGTGH